MAVVEDEVVATVMEAIKIKEPPETIETNLKAKPMTMIGARSLPEVVGAKISKVLMCKNFKKLVTPTIFHWDQAGQVGEKAPVYILVQKLKTVSHPLPI